MTALNADIRAALVASGFKKIASDEYARDPNSADVAHHLFFERMQKVYRGHVKVGVAIRHVGVERSLGPVFRTLGLHAWSNGIAAQGGGFTLGIELGHLPPAELHWDAPITWPATGETMSLAQAVRGMNRILTLSDIHARYSSGSPLRESWVLHNDQGWLRHLIIVEMLRTRGLLEPTKHELSTIRAGLAKHGRFQHFPFEQVREAVQAVV